jgi:hypothetical protein
MMVEYIPMDGEDRAKIHVSSPLPLAQWKVSLLLESTSPAAIYTDMVPSAFNPE